LRKSQEVAGRSPSSIVLTAAAAGGRVLRPQRVKRGEDAWDLPGRGRDVKESPVGL
jgi:8-oxo-dGTP pyrophosphatase MutT (NUDIX family)